jgi:hypothetical protein
MLVKLFYFCIEPDSFPDRVATRFFYALHVLENIIVFSEASRDIDTSLIHHSMSGRINLLLGGGLGEVGEGLAALELGVLDHTWGKRRVRMIF